MKTFTRSLLAFGMVAALGLGLGAAKARAQLSISIGSGYGAYPVVPAPVVVPPPVYTAPPVIVAPRPPVPYYRGRYYPSPYWGPRRGHGHGPRGSHHGYGGYRGRGPGGHSGWGHHGGPGPRR